MLVSNPIRLSAITRSSSQASAATLTCWPSACSEPTKPSGWNGRMGKVPSSSVLELAPFSDGMVMRHVPFYGWLRHPASFHPAIYHLPLFLPGSLCFPCSPLMGTDDEISLGPLL